MMKYKLGLAIGTYDLFHVGHLKFLEQASRMCDCLIVGIDSDERVLQYKGHFPIVSEAERMDIVGALKCVKKVVINYDGDGVDEWAKLGVDVVFIGANWRQDEVWLQKSERLREKGILVQYIEPYPGISTTQIINKVLLIKSNS